MDKQNGSGRGKKVMFYVQHLLGIGHLARASRISAALIEEGFDVTVVTGGKRVEGFPGKGIKHVALPGIASDNASFSKLIDENGTPVDDAFKAMRAELLIKTYHDIAPDFVLVEAFPFGRRQVRFELLPLMETIQASDNKPIVIGSVRDILQEKIKPSRNEDTVQYIDQYFDHIFVHGDPDFMPFEATFPLFDRIKDKVRYTGIVAAPPPEEPEDTFAVVVSAGGGAVGRDLVTASLEAAKNSPLPGNWCIITGPNLPQVEFEQFRADAPSHVQIERFRTDFASLLKGASLSVSQSGYNTVCDILRAQCGSVLVPYTSGGETEQTRRAEKLEGLGLATYLNSDDLSGPTIVAAMREEMDRMARRPAFKISLDGAKTTAHMLRALA
ncbi:glycosyltransferase family protein [Cohaesibacter intestini]|uniref:glycosyltransferase family protein n=1 Tax=Cohaesibacter intestini TaxID=2211145 RepID=UPI000DEA9787|nr:glycosyltransferase [Cohaesibacter intestini]